MTGPRVLGSARLLPGAPADAGWDYGIEPGYLSRLLEHRRAGTPGGRPGDRPGASWAPLLSYAARAVVHGSCTAAPRRLPVQGVAGASWAGDPTFRLPCGANHIQIEVLPLIPGPHLLQVGARLTVMHSIGNSNLALRLVAYPARSSRAPLSQGSRPYLTVGATPPLWLSA